MTNARGPFILTLCREYGLWVGLIMVMMACLYGAVSGPIQWLDSGTFLVNAAQLPLLVTQQSPTFHPFYHLLTVVMHRLFGPLGVTHLNFLLTIPVGVAVAGLSRTIGINKPGSYVAVLAVLLANNVYWVATKVEVYTLHLLLILLLYWLAFLPRKNWHGLVMGVLAGLALSTHQLTLVVCFPLVMYWLLTERWRLWPMILGGLVGLIPLYPAFWGTDYGLIDTFLFLIASRVPHVSGESTLFRFDAIPYNMPYIALLIPSIIGFPLFGLYPARFTRMQWVLWGGGLFNLVFAISFNAPDRFQFCLPGIAILAVLGVQTWLKWVPLRSFSSHLLTLLLVLLPPIVAVGVYALTLGNLIALPKHKVSLPFRNDVAYFMVPYWPDHSASQFVTAYDAQVPTGQMVLADRTIMQAFLSAQLIGRFKGRILVDIDALACHPSFRATHTIAAHHGLILTVPPDATDAPATTTPPPFPSGLRDTIHIIRYEALISPWYDLQPAPIGWVGTKKQGPPL